MRAGKENGGGSFPGGMNESEIVRYVGKFSVVETNVEESSNKVGEIGNCDRGKGRFVRSRFRVDCDIYISWT